MTKVIYTFDSSGAFCGFLISKVIKSSLMTIQVIGAENLHYNTLNILNCAIDHRIRYMYFSAKGSMHTIIETNKLTLPVLLFYLSRPSRNRYCDG